MAAGVQQPPVVRGRSQRKQATASRDTTDRKDKYGARKETAMRKASQLCTLTGNRVFAGIANGRGNTVWPPDNYSELIGSYRLRRDIQSYQLLKEGKRKMPGDARKQDGVSATFAPLSVGLLQNCVADLVLKLKYVDNIIDSRRRDHDTYSLDASQLQKMPSPGPALLDYTANRSSEYWEALDVYASDSGMDTSEAYSEFDYVSGWCYDAPALLDYTANRSSEYWEALDVYASDSGMDASEAYSEFDYVSGWCYDAPALLDYTANRSSEYKEALDVYASDGGMDTSEAYSEFDCVSGWCYDAPAL